MFTSSNCSMIFEKLFEKKKSLCVCVYIQTDRETEGEREKKEITLDTIYTSKHFSLLGHKDRTVFK